METPILKWMIWGYPYFRKPPCLKSSATVDGFRNPAPMDETLRIMGRFSQRFQLGFIATIHTKVGEPQEKTGDFGWTCNHWEVFFKKTLTIVFRMILQVGIWRTTWRQHERVMGMFGGETPRRAAEVRVAKRKTCETRNRPWDTRCQSKTMKSWTKLINSDM